MANTVNHETCKKCKLCIEVCPVKMIGVNQENLIDFIPERESICIECGQCMAVCLTDSIKIDKYSYKTDLVQLPNNTVNYETYINFIANRRSIRNFKNKKIDKTIITNILESIKYAPYGAEPDKVNITIINNREIIEKALPPMEKFLNDIVKWVDNPIISRIIKFKKGIETFSTIKNHLYPMSKLENYKLKYGDRITRGAQSIIILHAKPNAEEHTNNSLIYATYMMFAIHSLGLGSSMNGIIPASINKVKEVKEIFKIPEENEAIISIMLGYPKYKYTKTVKREKTHISYIE